MIKGKTNLLRLRQEIPLSEEEVAAVDDGMVAMERLLKALVDVPTPSDKTHRDMKSVDSIRVASMR